MRRKKIIMKMNDRKGNVESCLTGGVLQIHDSRVAGQPLLCQSLSYKHLTENNSQKNKIMNQRNRRKKLWWRTRCEKERESWRCYTAVDGEPAVVTLDSPLILTLFPFLDSYKLKNELIIRNRKTGTRDRNESEVNMEEEIVCNRERDLAVIACFLLQSSLFLQLN